MGKYSKQSQIELRATLALILASAIGVPRGQTAPPPETSDFKVTLLGTSMPNPLADRFGPSTLVEAGHERLVFDCGRGCTIRLWQLRIPLGTIKLFITHLHSDHTVGIPDLWLTGLPEFAVWEPQRAIRRLGSERHCGNDVLPREGVPH